MNIVCSMKHEACLTPTLNKLVSSLELGVPPHPDVASGIYCNGMRTAGMETYMKLLQRASESTSQTERNIVFSAIGCSNNSAIIENFMTFALESSSLSIGERQRILLSTINNGEEAIDSLIAFIFANHEDIGALKILPTLLSSVSDRIVAQKMFDAFVVDLDMYLGLKYISEEMHVNFEERAQVIMDWQSKNVNIFASFFEVPTESTTEETTTTTSTEPTTSTTSTSSTTTSTVKPSTDNASSITISISLLIISIIVKNMM
jgi:aminopeptidase N